MPDPRRAMHADALSLLLAKHGLELARHIRRIVRDDHVTEDLLQDTLLRTHGALGRLRPGSNERAWLYRIATNAALNHVRGRARELAALRRYAQEADGATSANAASRADAADRRTTDGDVHAALWARVATLPERQRVALTLRISDELDYAGIARRMGGTEAAARANVHQATKRLKREFR
jgi:RNA polymerase sigma-70 factor (ECF subfamily)